MSPKVTSQVTPQVTPQVAPNVTPKVSKSDRLLTQVLEEASNQLRAELGLVSVPALQPEEAPRFSKRARQMAPEMELGTDAAAHLSEAHAAHLRYISVPMPMPVPVSPFMPRTAVTCIICCDG